MGPQGRNTAQEDGQVLRTGFFIFVNQSLVQWLLKKQATIETSVFGAKFVALKDGMESLRRLRYKLRMMGVLRRVFSLVNMINMLIEFLQADRNRDDQLWWTERNMKYRRKYYKNMTAQTTSCRYNFSFDLYAMLFSVLHNK